MKLSHQQSTKYKLVIFDFDGTIADTSPGILDAHRFALQAMSRQVPCESELRKVIGGNLLKTYISTFGFEEATARKAVQIYRARYAQAGIHMAHLYPGFTELLKGLKGLDCKIGVATLKAESFAKTMLFELGIDGYFDSVCGMDAQDGLSKSELVLKCCSLCGVDQTDAVLIGDSNNDWIGSQEARVDFIGVTYGFGFVREKSYCFETAETTDEVLALIREGNNEGN